MNATPRRRGDILNGRWQLNEQLGQGAMGSVYQGHDLVLQRPIAIKVLSADFLDDELMLARFRREALSSSRLVHPNIVTTLDFGVDAGVPYIVMELIDGVGLDQLLLRERRLGVQRAARLAQQVAQGLDAAHRQGIVHRDIKPANIMVSGTDSSEVARLVDFGIAYSASAGPRLTQVGLAVGTPGYVAPEQLSGGEVDGFADVFSLGVMLFEMLAGTLPWDQRDPTALLAAVLNDRPQDLHEFRPDVPQDLRDLTMSMIRVARSERPTSAGHIAEELAPFVDAQHSTTGTGSESSARAAVLAAASVDEHGPTSMRQLEWFVKAVEAEGGTLAQSIGREVLATLPSAEAALRLTRTRPSAAVETARPSLAFHIGAATIDETGMTLGPGVRVALRLARLAGPSEVLLTADLHDAVGLGWRARVEPRGKCVLEPDAHWDVYALRGGVPEAAEEAQVETHPDDPHWRCPSCGSHGRIPATSSHELRVRCSMCSRLLEVNTTQSPALPVDDASHPLTSIVLTAAKPPKTADEAEDTDLISALCDFGE